jgi:EAL and modified HD-GYP domain-containing signal transduction protein
MAESVLFARQPILDQQKKLVAYELLYRDALRPIVNQRDGDRATGKVVVGALSAMHDAPGAISVPMFVNLTRSVLLAFTDPPFPPEFMVLELLEDINVDAAVVDAVKDLKAKGYRIALDDFVWRESWRPLLPLADIIKVDVLDCPAAEVTFLAQRLQRFDATLLAEKVESRTMFEHCKRLGFELFQGYFFARPESVAGKKLSPNAGALLDLVGQLNKAEITTQELGEVIRRDAVLSVKLLRLVNSAAFQSGRKIDSVRQAIALLGLNRLRSWVMLLLLAGVADKPHELLRLIVLRAGMAERLSRALKIDTPERCFTAALFSGMDAMLDVPLPEIMARLPVSDALRLAVTEGEGEIGALLRAVKAYEQADWDSVSTALPKAELDALFDAYVESLVWTDSVLRDVQ